MKSKLNLQKYHFTSLEVKAAPVAISYPFDLKVTTRRHYWMAEKKPRDWKVALEIDFGGAKDDHSDVPYHGTVTAVGFFKVEADYPDSDVFGLIKITGSSLLYGAAREMVATVSARGPYPPLILPSVSFYEEEKAAAKTKVKVKKTKGT